MNEAQAAGKARDEAVRNVILEKWATFDGDPASYPWPWEAGRWHELVFCIIHRFGAPDGDPELERELVDVLADLGVLSLQELSGSVRDDGVDLSESAPRLLRELLIRAGMSEAKATDAVVTIVETAAAVQRGYGGKIQRYLRGYGERMLAELGEHFEWSRLSGDDARFVFTHWLQNVLNLPLPLSDSALLEICSDLEVPLEELIVQADELDLNLALLDDMAASETIPDDAE